MFGTYRTKVGNRVAYYKNEGSMTYIYNKDGKIIMSYYRNNYLCSFTILQGINFTYSNSDKDEELAINVFNKIARQQLIITFQNVSKNGYGICKKLGFTDFIRLPGSYLEGGYRGKERVSSCMSLMVKSTRKLEDSINVSLAQLQELANGENL